MTRVAVALTLALIAACSNGGGGDDSPSTEGPDDATDATDTAESADAFTPQSIEWEDCLDGAECASLRVPADYDDPDGSTLEIGMARLPAQDEDERIGPLFVNPGGPGASAIDFALTWDWPEPLRERFDIIGIDPRGVGRSTRLECAETVPEWWHTDPVPDSPEEEATLDEAATTVADECTEDDGELLSHVSTADTARDMETVRVALDEAQISYYGASYGTYLGQLYLELFPESVRVAVLDGLVDPDQDLAQALLDQARGYEEGLDRIFESCGSGCPVDDPEAAFASVQAAVEEDDLPGGPAGLGPGEFGRASFYSTYDQSLWEPYLQGLADALEGDGAALAGLAEDYDTGSSFTAYLAISCLDQVHPVGPEEWTEFADDVIAQAPRLGGDDANELRPCAFWPVDTEGDPRVIVAEGSGPVLVVGNTGDFVTPLDAAERVADNLAEGQLLTVDGDTHTALGIPCADEQTTDFLVDAGTDVEDC